MDAHGFEMVKAVLRDDSEIYPEPILNESVAFVRIGHPAESEIRAVDVLNALAQRGFMDDGKPRDLGYEGPAFELVDIDHSTEAVFLRDTRA